MKIVIIGAGDVGFHLAKHLAYEGHALTLIEEDSEKCERAREILDVSVILGSGTDQEVLKEAGLRGSDMLIAASGVDEVNIIACLFAAKLGVKRKIARVRAPGYYKHDSILKPIDLGIDLFIHPEEEVSGEIVRLLMRSTASEIIEFEGGKILMLGMKVDPTFPYINKQLKDMGTAEQRRHFRILAVLKGDKTIIPTGDDYISKNDQVFVVTERDYLPELLKLAGKAEEKLEKVMILGGGKIGRNVAQALEKRQIDVIIVESDKAKSLKIAGQLDKTVIMHADGTEIDSLVREGILNMDALVAVTSDDENNMIACLLAKHLGIRRTIALVNKVNYLPLMPIIGIDSTVNTRISTVSAILRLIRRGEILSVATFHGIDAEAIEVEISAKDKLTGKPLRNLKLPEDALVASIVRGKEVFVPYGDTIINPGDKIIVFALPHAIKAIENRLS
jgi:trk system potassium uptake protein TrkA